MWILRFQCKSPSSIIQTKAILNTFGPLKTLLRKWWSILIELRNMDMFGYPSETSGMSHPSTCATSFLKTWPLWSWTSDTWDTSEWKVDTHHVKYQHRIWPRVHHRDRVEFECLVGGYWQHANNNLTSEMVKWWTCWEIVEKIPNKRVLPISRADGGWVQIRDSQSSLEC